MNVRKRNGVSSFPPTSAANSFTSASVLPTAVKIGATIPLMTDWLLLLIRIGGNIAVLAVAVFLLGKWLWSKIDKALDSYTTSYLQQKAAIDARIEHLEKLAEEQARLTRTVEGIKDEIAAQAKSRDNQWALKKELYYNLIKSTSDMIRLNIRRAELHEARINRYGGENLPDEFLKHLNGVSESYVMATDEFVTQCNLAPMGMANEVNALAKRVRKLFRKPVDFNSDGWRTQLDEMTSALKDLITALQVAARNDLWGTTDVPAKAEAAKQS